MKLDFPILSDPDGKIATAFGIYNRVIKIPGRKTFYIGKDGRILHVDQKVNVTRHAQDIAAQLEKLNVAKRSSKTDKPKSK